MSKLIEAEYELYKKYYPVFKARLTAAMGRELIEIEKEYGVILVPTEDLKESMYFSIYFQPQDISVNSISQWIIKKEVRVFCIIVLKEQLIR